MAAAQGNAGLGHVYQGRYESFPLENDEHFWVVARYVERNAQRGVSRLASGGRKLRNDQPWNRPIGGAVAHEKLAAIKMPPLNEIARVESPSHITNIGPVPNVMDLSQTISAQAVNTH